MTDWVAIRASRMEVETRWKAEMAATQKVGTVQLNGRSRVATSSSATSGRSRAVIGIRDLAFHQEVLDWLDRDFHVELVGAAADPERLLSLLKPDQADVVVACPEMAKELAHPSARTQRPRTLVVAQEMTVPVLREAIEIGAFVTAIDPAPPPVVTFGGGPTQADSLHTWAGAIDASPTDASAEVFSVPAGYRPYVLLGFLGYELDVL